MKNTTRRGILGAIAVAPVAAMIAPATATPPNAAQGISPALAHLFAEVERTKAEAERYDAEVFEPMRARWLAEKAAVPHIEFEGVARWDGGPAIWSTAQEQRVQHARWAVGQKHTFAGPGADHAREAYQSMSKLVAAANKRERAFVRINQQLGFEAIYDESARLSDVYVEAIDAVVEFPAASLADLSAKVDFMLLVDGFGRDDAPEIIRSDVTRIQQREA